MHHSAISRARKDVSKRKFKSMGDHKAFLSRIKKSLYYGKLPDTERFSLPVSEIAAEIFSKINNKSLDRLYIGEAAALSRKACVSPCSLVLALLYLERLKKCNSEYLERVAPSELFLVSMMIASKFLHDDGVKDEVFNDEWAYSGGLDVKEVNRFEKDFLEAIGWEVFVSEQDFWTRLRELETDVALQEGKRRGWFSYADLYYVMENLDLSSVAQTVLSVSAVCLTSYTASVLTLIGSAFIVSQIPGNSIGSGLSSLSHPRVSPALPPVVDDSTSLHLPVAPVLDEESETILSSLLSRSDYGLGSCKHKLGNLPPNSEAHNFTRPPCTSITFGWSSYRESFLSNEVKHNGSCEGCSLNDKESNIVHLIPEFHDSRADLIGDYLGVLMKWVLWASALLEAPKTIHDMGHSVCYWPREVSARC